MTKKRFSKKKKDCQLSDDNSTKDGITTPHGSIAGEGPRVVTSIRMGISFRV